MSTAGGIVYVVDDEAGMRKGLIRLLRAEHCGRVMEKMGVVSVVELARAADLRGRRDEPWRVTKIWF